MVISLDFAGFVNYISRTCKDGEHPFSDELVYVERESCIENFKYHGPSSTYNSETLCRCSEDLCNTKPIQELNLSKCFLSKPLKAHITN